MTSPSLLVPVIVPAGKERVIRAFGDEMYLHLSGEDTGGRFTMFTAITPPGGGPPPHIHHEEDEWFHVLEGDAEFFNDGEWFKVPVGSTIFMPKGSFHTFRNAGTIPLRQLITLSPAGFEVFFSRCAEEFTQNSPPDLDRVLAIAAEHQITFPPMKA